METNEKKSLPRLMADLYYDGLVKIFEKEKIDDDYFNQKYFNTCEDRIRAASNIAQEPSIKAGALAAVKHRIDDHKDKREDEQSVLRSSVSTETKAKVEGETWWMF